MRKLFLFCLLGIAPISMAYTATDSCTGTTSCSLTGTHAATDLVFVWTWRAASTTAPSLGAGFTAVTNSSSSIGASRSWRAGCIIAGTTGTIATGTWTNATNLIAFTISGTGATSTGDCRTNGIGSLGTPNNVSSATATYSALTMSAAPTGSSIALLVMGSSTSGQTCTPTGATSINSTGDVRASLANAAGNWSSATCSITSSVTTEIVIELMAPAVAIPIFSPNGGTFGTSASETLTDSTSGSTICYTTDGTTPAATTGGTCSAGSTYSSPFSVSATGSVLQALGTKTALTNSAVTSSGTFTINPFFPGLALFGVSSIITLQTWTTSSGWSATGQTTTQQSCANACAAVTLTHATVAGDLLYLESYSGASDPTFIISSVSGGGTWVTSANCNKNFAGAGTISCAWVLSATGGVTSVTVTMAASMTGGNGPYFHFRSYHPSATTAVAETVPAATTSAGCSNNCTTPTVTLTGSGPSGLIIAAIVGGNTGCSVASPYGNFSAPTGDGIADQFNVTSGTGATFTQGTACPTAASGVAAMSTVAFK